MTDRPTTTGPLDASPSRKSSTLLMHDSDTDDSERVEPTARWQDKWEGEDE